MIKHHPKFQLIQGFVNGELPASLSAGIAIHADLCSECRQQISLLTEQLSYASFEQVSVDKYSVSDSGKQDNVTPLYFEQAIAAITKSNDIDIIEPKIEKNIIFKNHVYSLPFVLHNMALGKTVNIGKLARARIQLD